MYFKGLEKQVFGSDSLNQQQQQKPGSGGWRQRRKHTNGPVGGGDDATATAEAAQPAAPLMTSFHYSYKMDPTRGGEMKRSITEKLLKHMVYLERELNGLITKLVQLGVAEVETDYGTSYDLHKDLNELKGKMRTLRRWRNGSERFRRADLMSMDDYILQAKFRAVEVDVLKVGTDMHKDAAAKTLTARDRRKIQLGLDDVRESLIRSRNEGHTSEAEVDEMYKKMDAVRTVLLTKIRTPSVKEKDAKDLDREKRTGSVGAPDEKTKLPLAEEDSRGPTNHLLRVIGRIRRLLTQLAQGGHIEAVGAEQCRENDELVLNRQLVKLQRWQQSVTQNSAEYNEKDVVDVEDIVSFIANHIRPEVTAADEPALKIDALTFDFETDATITCHDSLPRSEAPPTYEEAVGITAPQAEEIDERLI